MARKNGPDDDNQTEADVTMQADGPTKEDVARAVGVAPEEVLSFKLYEDRLVVVTTSGQKLEKTR